MFKVVFQVTCMVLLVTIFYDVLSCKRLYNTHTYRYIKQFGTSRNGKTFLRKLRKVKRRFIKSSIWPSCSFPVQYSDNLYHFEPYACLTYDWSLILKESAASLMDNLIIFLYKNISIIRYCISVPFEGLLKILKASTFTISRIVQNCADTAVDDPVNFRIGYEKVCFPNYVIANIRNTKVVMFL